MADNMIVVTNNYPFGKGEEFLETEINYLSSSFDRILIIALSQDPEVTRTVPKNVVYERFPDRRSLLGKMCALRHIFDPRFFQEVMYVRNNYRLRVGRRVVRSMLSVMQSGQMIQKTIKNLIKAHNISGDIYLYSYWMNSAAYALSLYKEKQNKVRAFCRSHGYDLYFYRNRDNYLPFRSYILNTLDSVYVISDDGKRYLENKVGDVARGKCVVSRLGVSNEYPSSPSSGDGIFRIVSCSSMSEVKRIDLLIETLSGILGIDISWTHIGGGTLERELRALAEDKLKDKRNIAYEFRGHMANKEVYEYYANNPVDVFVNLSSSEGVPVSMMEAFSFSIPIIATDVGGVSEIVDDTNGILLSNDPSIEEIRSALVKFAHSSVEDIMRYKRNAYKTWKTKYNADTNYRRFVEKIKLGGRHEQENIWV